MSKASAAAELGLDVNALPPAPLHERVAMMAGDPERPVNLQVTIYTPDGAGPFPLAIVNHGASGDAQRPQDTPRYRYTYAAYYFLSRGYAVAMPMMRGFAGSEGHDIAHGCDLAGLGLEDARDIKAVIGELGEEPDIDASRVVVEGQSFGGWNTLALGSLRLATVRALINFSGGVRSPTCQGTLGDRSLAEAAERFGKQTIVPSIWFYGDNDSLFSPALWREMYDRYRAAGAEAELVSVGTFMDDSHTMLGRLEALPLWVPKVNAFLQRLGLPSGERFPQYLPLPLPAPTHFASIDDENALPNATAADRAAYRSFLQAPLPRAFVMTVDGKSVSSHGGFDPFGRALRLCREHGLLCRPYAIDNDVVWVDLPKPVASDFAALTDIDAVPYLSARAKKDGYQRFLLLPLPRAFVLSPDGSYAGSAGGNPLQSAMNHCRALHPACAAYAVDDVVVWKGAAH